MIVRADQDRVLAVEEPTRHSNSSGVPSAGIVSIVVLGNGWFLTTRWEVTHPVHDWRQAEFAHQIADLQSSESLGRKRSTLCNGRIGHQTEIGHRPTSHFTS